MIIEAKVAVETLIMKAKNAEESCDALRFAQAAHEAANALCALENARLIAKD